MTNDKITLPRDAVHHDKVFTYVHVSNTLYRGTTPLSSPAVLKLPCPGHATRNYHSTIARRTLHSLLKYRKFLM
jgi:hypothetical protein